MKTALYIYASLLKLYPHSYRKTFGEQMLQTFLDHYQDVAESGGRAGLGFWLSLVTDEIKNIMEQHMASLLEGNPFLKITAARLVLSAMLSVPLTAVFYAALVRVVLALPHPHVNGIGALLTLVTLFLIPLIVSMMTGYLLVIGLTSIFSKCKVRMV